MSPVKAPPLDVPGLVAGLERAASEQGFRVERYGQVGDVPLIALTKRTPGVRPRIYLSAGIHGDEPAPPQALFGLLKAGFFKAQADWFIVPVINPHGLARATRENAAGVDLNRDFKHLASPEIQALVRWLRAQPNFDLSMCLHEDWESTGFYLYELNPTLRPTLADGLIAAARPIMPIDPAEQIDGREAKGGIIRPPPDPALRELWPESIYLLSQHVTLSYTVETPSSLPMHQRVETLQAIVRAAVSAPSLSRCRSAQGRAPAAP